jgi:transcriptional regulator with XRE-family HTH domain
MGPEKTALRNLAKNVRRFRTEKGWSQDDLAEEFGSDRTYISDIERQLRNPSLRTIARLAHALGVRIGELCDASE